MNCLEMRPGRYYMHRRHLYKTDGLSWWRRPFDVWSGRYLPIWEKVWFDDIRDLDFEAVEPGTRFGVLP